MGMVLVACRGTTTSSAPALASLTVTVHPDLVEGVISPYIRGLSGDADAEYLRDVGITVDSWGGNPSTRYNYGQGHAWNSGADYQYRNGNYGAQGDAARQFVATSLAGGASVRLAVPTLGWVAKNDDSNTCSFPDGAGGCGTAGGASCHHKGAVADPTTANVASTPDSVRTWIAGLVTDPAVELRFIAMDNEPELWGVNHYDVHPDCTTYEEVLDRYLTYADAMHDVAPKALLMGPVTCCWFSYWKAAPGPANGDHTDFVAWFLQQLSRHDQQRGRRTLDVLDVHYYPQSDVYNDKADAATSARRLRSTRSLWDPTYTDESWIDDQIQFIPRLRDIAAKNYPGTTIGISEWNFGADGTMNGALAIADVLGIYGEQGVYEASYWRSPKARTPGYFAFKMFGNFDGQGSSFGGEALAAPSSDVTRLGSYAALDRASGHLRVVLINKSPDRNETVHVDLGGYRGAAEGRRFEYSGANADQITNGPVTVVRGGVDVVLPASSITLIDLAP